MRSIPWTAIRSVLLCVALVSSASAQTDLAINEIRIDQPGADDDEFFELAGAPGTPLDGLTYLVLGDGAGGSGVIEAVVDLGGQSIGASGFFVAAEAGFTLGGADLGTTLDFENSDNVTHLLVSGFFGNLGDDLDLDDDGALDVIPWLELVDGVALVEEENPPMATERLYVLDERVGPDGGQVPGHVIRCPDATGELRVASFDPADGDDTPGAANLCAPVNAPVPLSIPEIQGADHVSAFDGQLVVTRGVVTAVDSNGFYLQDPAGDDDPATSDGLFVFAGGAPGVFVGDWLEVTATVDEFVPGGASSGNLSITELIAPVAVRLGSAALPPPVILGRDGRRPPTQIIDDDAFTLFDPAEDGIDFFESLEGMRVTLVAARAVSGTNRFGEVVTVVDDGADATGLSERGTLNISPLDFNPERVQVQTDAGLLDADLPPVDVGARLGDLTGVVSYSFGSFEVLLSEPFGEPVPSDLEVERTRLRSRGRDLRVASFNLLNLDPNDSDGDTDVADGRFEAIARIVVASLQSPEILALQEVQDNDGSEISDVTAADQTLGRLVQAIRDAGGPEYAFIDHPFIGNGTSGGQPGGNIRVAYLYDPGVVTLVPGSVAPLTDPEAQQTDPSSPFFRSRPPLVARFRAGQATLTLVNVHFSSKGGSSPLFGQIQPATLLQEDPDVNGGVDARRIQALAVADLVAEQLDSDPDANLVVLGDFNEFEFISPLAILGERLMNLTWTLPADERYTFVFEGSSQSLDHVLVSPSLRGRAELDIVHVNSERAETPERASDHDPILARVRVRPSRGDRRSGLERWLLRYR